jgi:hypothetical protein
MKIERENKGKKILRNILSKSKVRCTPKMEIYDSAMREDSSLD